MTCQTMMSLGVYVLGAADAEESRQVRAHLPDCPACRAELALLRPLPGLLARVPEDTLAADPPLGRAADQGPGRGARQRPGWGADRGPGWGADRGPGWGADQRADRSAALVSGRPAERSASVRSRRRSSRTWRAAAMAASVAAIAGSAGGFWLAPRAGGHRPATVTLSGANPALHVSATAALTATSWGTSIELRVDGLPLNVPCRLIVRSRAGATEITGVWDAWRTGPVTVPASADWLPSDIASLQVATTTRNLVTISGWPAKVAG
jgi:anti-sigma factor RsiW